MLKSIAKYFGLLKTLLAIYPDFTTANPKVLHMAGFVWEPSMGQKIDMRPTNQKVVVNLDF